MTNDVAAPGQDSLIRGYRPEALPLRLLRRELRDLQTHFPAIRAAKFDFYNMATRRLGLFADAEIRLLSRLAPVDLALDVGGNWGQSVVALQRYARPQRIVTVEPIPFLAERLRRKYPPGGSVEVLEMGLGLDRGQQLIHVPRYRGYVYDGIASLDREAAAAWLDPRRMARFSPAHLTIDTHEVKVERLDALGIAPDVIKIDVQGFEGQVIAGGIRTIAAHKPVVIVERPSEAVVAALARLGLAAHGWNGRKLVAGDLTRNNAIFLGPQHKALLG